MNEFINEMFDIKTSKSYPFEKNINKDPNVTYQASFETDAHISYTFRVLKKLPSRNYGKSTRILALYKKQTKNLSQNLTIDPGTMKKVLITFFKCYEDYKQENIDSRTVNSYSIILQPGIAKFKSLYVRATARAFRAQPRVQLIFYGINPKGKNNTTELFFVNKATNGLPVFSGPDWNVSYRDNDDFLELAKLAGIKITPHKPDSHVDNVPEPIRPEFKKPSEFVPNNTHSNDQQGTVTPKSDKSSTTVHVTDKNTSNDESESIISQLKPGCWCRINVQSEISAPNMLFKKNQHIYIPSGSIRRLQSGSYVGNEYYYIKTVAAEDYGYDNKIKLRAIFKGDGITIDNDNTLTVVSQDEFPTAIVKLSVHEYEFISEYGIGAIATDPIVNKMYIKNWINKKLTTNPKIGGKKPEPKDAKLKPREQNKGIKQPAIRKIDNDILVNIKPSDLTFISKVHVDGYEFDLDTQSIFDLRQKLNSIDATTLNPRAIRDSLKQLKETSKHNSSKLLEYITTNFDTIKPSDDRTRAIIEYTGTNYVSINDYLWGDESAGKHRFVHEGIETIDSCFADFGVALNKPIKLYRGSMIRKDELESLRKDKSFRIMSYGSFSSSPDITYSFIDLTQNGFFEDLSSKSLSSPAQTTFCDDVKADKVFIELNDISKALVLPIAGISAFAREYEYLLNRGSILSIKNPETDLFEIAYDPSRNNKLYYLKATARDSGLMEHVQNLYSFSDWKYINESLDKFDDMNTKSNMLNFYLQSVLQFKLNM